MHLLRDCFCSGQTLPLLGCWIGLYCDSSASLRTRGTTALAGMNKTRSYAASSTTGSTCRSSPDPPPSWCGGHSVSPRQAAAQSFDSRGTATSWLCSLCLMTQDSFCSITTGLLSKPDLAHVSATRANDACGTSDGRRARSFAQAATRQTTQLYTDSNEALHEALNGQQCAKGHEALHRQQCAKCAKPRFQPGPISPA